MKLICDPRPFAIISAICSTSWPGAKALVEGQETVQPFALERVATPTLTRYRDHLQHQLQLKPATINRHLVSLKRYFGWAADGQFISPQPGLSGQTRPADDSACTSPDRPGGGSAGGCG